MTVALVSPSVPGVDEHASVKTKKSKKSYREHERGTDKHGSVGDVDKPERERHRKDKKDTGSKSEGDHSMTVDDVADNEVTSPEKRKKCKREDDSKPDPNASKKDKKKRRKDGDIAEPAPLSGVDVKVNPDLSEHKRDKKKRKREAEANASGAEPEDPSTSISKKVKKKRKKDAASAASEPRSFSSKTTTPTGAPSSVDIDVFLSRHCVTIHVPQGAAQVTPILAFNQLAIPPELQSAFKGFKEPTPIQACSWPPALAGKDVVGIAETGSGKTLAFGLPALARLVSSSASSKGTTVSVLVMAPTRELAIQTHDTLSALGEPFGTASVAVFGGVDKGPQVKALKNANKDGKTTRIVVGTPGRILDLVNDGTCDLSRVSYLVLDEADRMLDKGFENDIRAIIGHTKQGTERQTLMFSATWPEAVRRLAASFQRDPVRITVGSDDLTANRRVEQVVEVFDDARSKDQRLLNHLRGPSHKKLGPLENTRILVFALYKKEATRVEGMLRSKGYTVGGLHGDMSQTARMDALQNFKTGKTDLLVATDVAARGLDIPDVTVVINYTFPLTIEDYIHRIGRTGRGGKSGKSITFFTGDAHERALAGELARVLRESGFDCEGLRKFPMTIKKKTHNVYGAFFKDDIPVPTGPTKIMFD